MNPRIHSQIMIFKVFYQVDHSRSPRRETTQTLYLELDTKDANEGIIQVRELIAANTDYHVEFIDVLSDKLAQYEKDTAGIEITNFTKVAKKTTTKKATAKKK